jgi:hypothetical protein
MFVLFSQLLLELGDWRMLYECAMGGRGEGPRQRRHSVTVLAADDAPEFLSRQQNDGEQ